MSSGIIASPSWLCRGRGSNGHTKLGDLGPWQAVVSRHRLQL